MTNFYDDVDDCPGVGPEPYWSDCDRYEPRPWWAKPESWRLDRGRIHNRLTHMVLLDGRLIETWAEPVEGTQWQHIADALDSSQERPAARPPRPPHEDALGWLDSLVGGRVALEALTDDPLPPPPLMRVDDLPLAARNRLEGVSRALDVLTELFDAETGCALKTVLTCLWEEDPEVVLKAKSAAQVAGGICWVVGRANDLFGPGRITQQATQEKIGLTTAISSFGSTVHRSLQGLQPTYAERPWSQRDLLATGRAGFLVSATRRRLVRLRDQAVAARETWVADEKLKGTILP